MMIKTGVIFKTENDDVQRLFDMAEKRCRGNLQSFGGRKVLVEGGGYEKIWLETQPMGGEMYAARDMEAALNNTLLFIETQREDGRIAGSIQCHEDGRIEPQFNKFQGFCFPWPALSLYYLAGRNRDYLNALANCLERFDAYLWRTRDSDGDGCLESFCVYDTGEDNAVRYGDSPVYCETDTPPINASVVPMASMDIMSFSYAARDTLSRISRIMGNGQEKKWLAEAQSVADALKSRLWNEKIGACFDRDKYGRTIPVLVHNNMRCMYWGSFSSGMADRFVREHLLCKDEFWTPLPLPSVAANDPAFCNAPENNWSGQAEGLTYQRAILALERYGYDEIVTKLGKKFLKAIIDGGYIFAQQFDPFTGKPSCVSSLTHKPVDSSDDVNLQNAYGPTLLAALEYIAHIWGVRRQMDEIWFSLGSGMVYTYEQCWDEHIYKIDSDGKRARIFFDGREIFTSDCGVRLITDENGVLLRTRKIEGDI